MARRDVRRYSDDSRDTFDKVGDSEAEVDNVSGQPSAYTEMRPRGRTMPTTPPGQHLSPRTARMIDAQSGQRLDADLARSVARAAERAALRKTIDNAHPSERETLAHLFGFTLGRDRA